MTTGKAGAFEVIPAIDLLAGGTVRLYQGRFDRISEYTADPVETARGYAEAGCRRLHVVDLDGARTGDAGNMPILKRLTRETGLSIQTGGGIRTIADARARFEAGASQLVIGSLAVREPDTIAAWMDEFGADAIVLALDVRIEDGIPIPQTHGWVDAFDTTLWDLLATYASRGARHVLCTDIARDGTLEGPNVELYTETAERFPTMQIQASGGVSRLADLESLARCGASAAITGKALLDGRITLQELGSFSRDA